MTRHCLLHATIIKRGDADGSAVASGDAGTASLAAASVITFKMDDRLRFREFTLRTANAATAGEPAALRLVDGWLERAHDAAADLVEWPDDALNWLRMRADRHWLFHLLRLPGWNRRSMLHLSVAATLAGSSDLVATCAGAGIAGLEDGIASPRALQAANASEAGVAGLFLLSLHAISRERGSADPLLRGWSALTSHLRRRPGGPGPLSGISCNGWLDLGSLTNPEHWDFGCGDRNGNHYDDDPPF